MRWLSWPWRECSRAPSRARGGCSSAGWVLERGEKSVRRAWWFGYRNGVTLSIDLRSDTVTRPTQAMRAAMAAAEVGDDVYGDDPTVNRLQSALAERFGFPGALFFPTGTQSNLAALMAHCDRGDEYLVGQDAHTYRYEQGGA